MPPKTPDLDERLRRVRDQRREPESDPPVSEGDRDSKQLHVNVYSSRRTEPAPRESGIRAILNNDWVKLIAAFVLGGAGGEAHSAVRGDSGGDDIRMERLEQQVKRRDKLLTERVDGIDQRTTTARIQLSSLGRYTYWVMKKQGVAVYAPPNGTEPVPLEFHPAPLKPTTAPLIQPAEGFPLPDRP